VVTLHPDSDMEAQPARTIIGAWADAADLGEALAVAGRVPAGDYRMWQQEWQAAATAPQSAADAAAARGAGTLTARGYLRSAEYHPGLLLPAAQPGRRSRPGQLRASARGLPPVTAVPAVPGRGGVDTVQPGPGLDAGLPVPPRTATPRPTALFTGGFDGTAEEPHEHGTRIAIEFGWNVAAWDGPGQDGMLVQHGQPMRPDFESVLTPVVDWAVAQPLFDAKRLPLVGRSPGGYLAPPGAGRADRSPAWPC
jgi:hypothetical protein